MNLQPRVDMSILRHRQSAVTMDVYAQVSSEGTPEALRQLGLALGASKVERYCCRLRLLTERGPLRKEKGAADLRWSQGDSNP